jgi:TPR repeat protein
MGARDQVPDASGPLKYAPKWARAAAPEPPLRRDRPNGGVAAENLRPRLVKLPPTPASPPPQRPREPPPWKPARQKGSFEGDVAVKELRERMALAPDLPPSPPLRDEGVSVFGMIGRLAVLVTLAAICAYGFVWISTPADQPGPEGLMPAGYQDTAAGEQADAAPVANRLGEQADAAQAGNRTAESAGSTAGAFTPAVFRPPPTPAAGLKAGTLRSRDDASPIQVPQGVAPAQWPASEAGRDLGKPREAPTTGVAVFSVAPTPAPANPPPRAVPIPEPEHTAVPPAAAAPGVAREEIATLLARGRTYLANGDVSAARLAFRRAAEGGDAQAALALGGTYDPLVLKSLGAIGVASDPALARNWYQKAAELGSAEAPQRINQLARSAR